MPNERLERDLDEIFGSVDDPIDLVAARAAVTLDGRHAIVWEGDAQTFQFSFVNEAAEQVLGYPRRRWVEEPTFWADVVVHPGDRDEAIAYCALATGRGKDHRFEYRARTSDGRVVWLRDYVRVVRGLRGVPQRLRGVMIDVTAERVEDDAARMRAWQVPSRDELLAAE